MTRQFVYGGGFILTVGCKLSPMLSASSDATDRSRRHAHDDCQHSGAELDSMGQRMSLSSRAFVDEHG